ncbi:MAG: choice-of-anchor P family protein [Marmoricola sp.]
MSRARRPIIAIGSAALATGAMVSTFAGSAVAATSSPAAVGTAYSGFSTAATASPFRIEMFEPAIPVPASPQVELDFSHTTVTGASGPDSTAMASAMWPGDAVGNGLPTILTASGLPASLAGNGYPVHTNAQYPGTPNSGSQEYFPGMVGRVSASDKQAVARAGYSSSGQVAGDGSSSAPNPLDQLKSGNLGALTGLLNPPGSDTNTGSNPLGVLSAIVSVGGMSSSSVTDYSDPSVVTATATSQLGEVDLLGGIVKLEGVTVKAACSSSLDGGGKVDQKVTYGGMTIAGTPFKFTSDGIEAATSKTAIPGMPSDPTKALASLGISIDLPKPTKTIAGNSATASTLGPQITIDTQPVISQLQLNKIPLSTIIDQFPESANQLKSTLLGVLAAHPKIVLALGDVSSSAQTSAGIGFGGGGATGGVSGGGTPSVGSGSVGGTGVPSGTGVTATPGGSAPSGATTPIKNAAAVPGLPPLGSIPSLLTIGGLILAAGIGWFFRAAALSALGAGSTCTHGLVTGLPDLRKA